MTQGLQDWLQQPTGANNGAGLCPSCVWYEVGWPGGNIQTFGSKSRQTEGKRGGVATALCLWEGGGYDREKQVCWSFDLKCSPTSLLQFRAGCVKLWKTGLVPVHALGCVSTLLV